MSQWYEVKSDDIELVDDEIQILFDYDKGVAGNRYVILKVSDIVNKLPPDPRIEKMFDLIEATIDHTKAKDEGTAIEAEIRGLLNGFLSKLLIELQQIAESGNDKLIPDYICGVCYHPKSSAESCTRTDCGVLL